MVDREMRIQQELDEQLPLERWYREYAPSGQRYAYSMLYSRADAEEVVQEAFCRLLKSGRLPTREGRGVSDDDSLNQFRGLFFTTVRNLCIDLLRRRKRSKPVSINDNYNGCLQIQAPTEDRLSTEQLSDQINRLIGTMPGNWADALKLKVNAELSYEQIANVLGCSHSQVRTWIYRARRYLAAELSKSEFRRFPHEQ